jgi:hypothetical protein
MRAHWRKIAYAAFWILLFAVTLESFAHPEADSETRAVMFLVIALFAAPISLIPLVFLGVVGWLSQGAESIITTAVFGSRVVQFSLWSLFMFGISYWQWFRLLPKLKSKFLGAPDA